MKKRKNKPTGGAADKGRRALVKIGLLVGNFFVLFLLFRLLIALGERTQQIWIYYVTVSVYAALGAGCFIAYFILNGMTVSNRDRTAEELPERWSDEKKEAFLASQPERRAKAKNLLYILLPLVVIFFISYFELTFFS